MLSLLSALPPLQLRPSPSHRRPWLALALSAVAAPGRACYGEGEERQSRKSRKTAVAAATMSAGQAVGRSGGGRRRLWQMPPLLALSMLFHADPASFSSASSAFSARIIVSPHEHAIKSATRARERGNTISLSLAFDASCLLFFFLFFRSPPFLPSIPDYNPPTGPLPRLSLRSSLRTALLSALGGSAEEGSSCRRRW